MTHKNRYYKGCRLPPRKFHRILRCFALDLTASRTAVLTGVSLRSVNAIFLKLRRRLAEDSEARAPVAGTVEVDESYFGARRVRGKPGRGAGGKTIVFGIYERNGEVYTEIVPDASKPALQSVIRGHVELGSVIHSDGLRSYNGLVDVGYDKHLRIRHVDRQFADGSNHINGIESFWSFAKRRLAKFNGIHKRTFYLHLKETEFRFNHRNQDLYRALLKLLTINPI